MKEIKKLLNKIFEWLWYKWESRHYQKIKLSDIFKETDDGKWHIVCASWNKKETKMYVDGKKIK